MFEDINSTFALIKDETEKMNDDFFLSFARIAFLMKKEDYLDFYDTKIDKFIINFDYLLDTTYLKIQQIRKKEEVVKKFLRKPKKINTEVLYDIISYEIISDNTKDITFYFDYNNIENLKNAFIEFSSFAKKALEKRKAEIEDKKEILNPIKEVVSEFIQLEKDLK